MDFAVTELLDLNPNEGNISLRGNRMLLFRADALFRLREELVRNLGEDIARNIITRFGYRCGSYDVLASRDFFNFESEAEWMLAGPKMHTLEGMVQATCDELRFDRHSGSFLMRGIWRNSYEAENYLHRYGTAKEPVCWTLTGYASGFGSGFMGREVVCVETMCQAAGHPYCRYEMRTLENWGGQAGRNIKDLQRNAVLKNFQTMLEEERERVSSWQLMNQAIIEISTNPSSSNMPVEAVEHAQKLLRAEKAVMAVITEKKKRVLIFETKGQEKICSRVLTDTCGVINSVFESRQPVEWYGEPLYIRGLGVEMRAMLGVPLRFKKDLIGALIVVNKNSGHRFSQHDREILSFLGAHSAVAVGNARAYEYTNQKLQENIAEIYRVNSLLLAEHEALQKSTNIHNRLTTLVLEGRGIEEIGLNLAGILSRPVLLADSFFHIISNSRPGEGRGDIGQAWQEAVRDGRLRDNSASLFTDGQLGRIPAVSETGKPAWLVLAPVTAGKENLGFVAALEEDLALTQPDCMAMEHAATVMALELLKQKATFETERRIKKDFLEELLEGSYENEEVITRRAERLGIDFTRISRVVAIDFVPGPPPSRHEGNVQGTGRLESFFQAVDRVVKPLGLVLVGKKNNIVGLLSLPGGRDKNPPSGQWNAAGELEGLFRKFFGEYRWWAGISSPCGRVAEFAGCYREACTTIDIMKSLGCENKCRAHEQLGVFGILNIDGGQFKKFIDRVMGPLLEYDEKHKSQLIHTLQIYFSCGCNLQRAARDGFMNSSTMKYRLRRITEIAGINLNDPEACLQVQLALRIMEGLK